MIMGSCWGVLLAQDNTICIKFNNGEVFENVAIKNIQDRSIFLEMGKLSKEVFIDSIDTVILSPQSRILKSAEIGGIVGGISGIVGSIIWYIVDKPKDETFLNGGVLHVFAPFQIAYWGYLIGLFVGIGYDIFAQDTVYNFIELTKVERINVIQKLLMAPK